MEKKYSKLNGKFRPEVILKKPVLILVAICIIGIILRIHYIPYGLPVTLDAFRGYFWYALDISILGHLPNYFLSQSGWGEFLSLFFMIFHSENLIEHMDLQRTISAVLSGLTVIPVYYICRKFFSDYFSLIGAIIFAFEPRIILNSILGISEPLYIFVISLGVLFFLSSNKKLIYSSFGFFAWATIIRPEGQFWFVIFSIFYFLRFRKYSKDLVKYTIPLLVFVLILSPFVYHRIQCCENDGIIVRILTEISNYSNDSDIVNENNNENVYDSNWVKGIKLFGWSLIPIFIIFIPLGLIPIFSKFNFPNYLLILTSTTMSIPILYFLSIAPDTRYLLVLYPIFCSISLFGINWVWIKTQNKIVLLTIIVLIIMSSIIFLEMQKNNYDEEIEAFQIARLFVDDINGVNRESEITKYIPIVELEKRWPIEETTSEYYKEYRIQLIELINYSSLNELIMDLKNKGISHIIIEKENNLQILDGIYYNEEKYDFLIKEFDSEDMGFEYKIKIFRINYE